MPSGYSKPRVGPPGVSGEPPLRSENVFRKQGEYWTIAYSGTILRLRDSKGLRYLARLLRHPGERRTAPELIEEQGVRVLGGYGVREESTSTANAQHPNTLSLERARVAVSQRIRGAIRKIEEHDPALGYKLCVSVKTGAHCVYLPDPERPIVWTA